MGEYISREAVLNLIEHNDKVCHYADERYENVVYATTQTICKVVAEMPVADVQPISQWISVKDRLPEPKKDVLVWYRYTWGAGFTSYRFGISKWYSNIKRWYEGCLPKDIEVLYWQLLSEPPKNGDAE